MVRHVQPGRPRITVPGFWDGDGIYKVRFTPPTTGPVAVRDAQQPAGVERQDRLVHRRAAVGEQSRPGAGLRHVLSALRRRHALSPVRHHLLRLGASDRASSRSRRSRRSPPRPSTRSGSASFPRAYAYNKNEPELFAFQKGADGKFDFNRPDPAFWRHFEQRILDLQKTRHRGGPHPLASLRPLGIRRHERRGGRPLSALLHRAALAPSATSGGRWPTNTIS